MEPQKETSKSYRPDKVAAAILLVPEAQARFRDSVAHRGGCMETIVLEFGLGGLMIASLAFATFVQCALAVIAASFGDGTDPSLEFIAVSRGTSSGKASLADLAGMGGIVEGAETDEALRTGARPNHEGRGGARKGVFLQ